MDKKYKNAQEFLESEDGHRVIEEAVDQFIEEVKDREDLVSSLFDGMTDEMFTYYVLTIIKDFHDNPYEKEKNKNIKEMYEIIDYIEYFGESYKPKDECMFVREAFRLRGFSCETIYGQGSFSVLYHGDERLCSTSC